MQIPVQLLKSCMNGLFSHAEGVENTTTKKAKLMPAVLNNDPATRDTFGHTIFLLSNKYENIMPPSSAGEKKPLRITFPLLRLKWAFKRLVLLSYFQILMNSSW